MASDDAEGERLLDGLKVDEARPERPVLLDERGAIAPTPLTGRIVEDYYFVGPRCDLVCGERVDGRP